MGTRRCLCSRARDAEVFELSDGLALAQPCGFYEAELLGVYVDARDPRDARGRPVVLIDVPAEHRLYQLLTPSARSKVESAIADTYHDRRALAA